MSATAALAAAYTLLADRAVEMDRALSAAGKEPQHLAELEAAMGEVERAEAIEGSDETTDLSELAAWVGRANQTFGGATGA